MMGGGISPELVTLWEAPSPWHHLQHTSDHQSYSSANRQSQIPFTFALSRVAALSNFPRLTSNKIMCSHFTPGLILHSHFHFVLIFSGTPYIDVFLCPSSCADFSLTVEVRELYSLKKIRPPEYGLE